MSQSEILQIARLVHAEVLSVPDLERNLLQDSVGSFRRIAAKQSAGCVLLRAAASQRCVDTCSP
jgi:hypothetical protein